jgi:NADH-quinone oxidoreductase subunit M
VLAIGWDYGADCLLMSEFMELNLLKGILSFLVFFPLFGAFILWLLKSKNASFCPIMALSISIVNFLVSLLLLTGFSSSTPGFQFEEKLDWIPSLGVSYHLGLDGISLFLVLLTTFLTPLAILGSWSAIQKQVHFFYLLMLILETGMIGVFVSLDLILFYFFWEAMLIPMVFLIGVWGGENRVYAAIKFFLYTMVGSVLMLVAIISLYLHNGSTSFDLLEIQQHLQNGQLFLTAREQMWLFLAFFFAFAIKVPIFPLHTWLPDAHVEAPTAGSVLLAGVLLKMGTYGILRFCLPLFPIASAELAPYISTLAVIGIVYGALVAMVQPDIKKLVAYSSVSHLGFVVLGIFTFNLQGMQGSLYQMLNHGISTGALFLLVGMIYERRHTRQIEQMGGLATPMPVYAAMFLMITLSSIGLPLMNGFVGEFLILLGAFQWNSSFAVIATTGVIFSAVYMLWMYQRVFLGEVIHEKNSSIPDLNWRERLILIPLIVMVLWMGVYSRPFLSRMESSVSQIIKSTQFSTIASSLKSGRHSK